MFNTDVWRPGAVDVDDGIGLVRHGMIRDLIPSTGLVIDFGYPDHHADLIPFSQCTTQPRTAKVTKSKRIETLFQRSPDQPWCWYPSKLVAGSLDTYAFVEIDFEREVFQDVIPLERIRPMRKDCRFRKHEVELPEIEEELLVATEKEKWVLPMWNSLTGTVGVRMEGRRLTYISQDSSPMTGDVVKEYIRRMVEDITTKECIRSIVLKILEEEFHEKQKEPKQMGNRLQEQQTNRGRKRDIDGAIISKSAATSVSHNTKKSRSCNISWMPVDILLKIFSFLNTDDQISSRAVCTTWNAVLTSVPASFRVQIDFTASSNEKLASTLHKMVTESTKILVLIGNHNETILTQNPFRVVFDLLKAKRMKIGTIVIARRYMWADDLLDYSDEQLKLRPEWSDVCEQLVLKEVKVCAVLGPQSRGRWRTFRDIGFRSYRARVPKDLVLRLTGSIAVGKEEGLMEALDLFEAGCPIMSMQKRTYVQQQWQNFGQNNGPALRIRQRLLKVIHYWQPSEPPPSANAEWSMEKLHSLRELTRHAVLFQREHDMRIRVLEIQRRLLVMQGIQ